MEDLVDIVRRRYQPRHWARQWTAEVELLDVPPESAEYKRVVSHIHETLPARVDYIVRIQNPYLWGYYLLKKAEYKCRLGYFSEKFLYHETQKCNVESIACNNFDWRRSGRRAKYGKGVSFSYSAQYAHMNCTNGGAMIVARVLVGNTEPGEWHDKIPQEGNDTTTSDGGEDCCNVYVKFSDHEFYPEYIVYFVKRRK